MRDANAVHEMVPVKPAGVETTMKLVVDMLKANPDKWYTSSQIADAIDRRSGNTEPGIRKAIAIALECYGVPIIASDRGYMFTTSDEALTSYMDKLAQRIRGVQARIVGVQRILTAHQHLRPVTGTFDENALEVELRAAKGEKITATDIVKMASRHGVPSSHVMKRLMAMYPTDQKAIDEYYESPEVKQWIL
jgi:hypothetical protein